MADTAVALPPLVTIPDVDVLAAGTWDLSTGEATFTAEDLAAAVDAAQCPAVGPPILKIAHADTSPRWPAVGRVANMALADSGAKITGDLAGMPGWLGAILPSAYPKRSIEGAWDFRCQIGHVHPFVIRALALLGEMPPGVGVLGDLDDVAALYGLTEAAGEPRVTWRLDLDGGAMPGAAIAAGVTTEDVRRAYYDSASVPMSYWITEIQMDPPQLIVSDDATAKVYRVPVSIKGGDVTFGDAQEVAVEYVDIKGGAGQRLRWATAEASREVLAWTASTQLKNMGTDPSSSAIKKMFALPGDTKSDSKLPHHTCGADGTVGGPDLAGCQAAIGVINGARGGLKGVSAADQKSAYNHLAGHVRALGGEPAEYSGPAAQAAGDTPAADCAAEGHGACTGTHTHAHSAMGSQGGDATHAHKHSHEGEANHGHAHAKAGGNRKGGSDVDITDEQMASLRAALGLADDAELDGAALLASVASLAEKAQAVSASGATKGLPPNVMVVDREAWTALNDKVAAGDAYRKRQERGERDAVISAAIGAGKFSRAQQERWEKLWDRDPDGTREVIASLAKNVVPVDDIGSPSADDDEMDREYASLFPPGAFPATGGEPARK